MLLRERNSGHMIDVASHLSLIDLNSDVVVGCSQEGEEVQDPSEYRKRDLEFLSGEPLPRCWTDPRSLTVPLQHSRRGASVNGQVATCRTATNGGPKKTEVTLL